MNAFRFVGKLEFNALDSKLPYIRSGKTGKGNDYKSLSFSVVPDKNNRAFVETFGMVQDKIKTSDSDGKAIEVNWAERLDEAKVNEVARYRRFFVKLNGKYNEFISGYDFIQFVNEHLEELRGKVCVVTGSISVNVYEGKISFRYQAQSIREVADDEDVEQKLTVRFDTFYRKEDFDFDRWSKEKEITVNAFTYQYIDKDSGKKYVPTTFFINLAKNDNEKQNAFFLKQFGIVLDGDSIKTKIKDKEVASLPVRCDFINGSEEVPFDESCLTDNQKEMIELGLKTLDDFRPNGSIYGQRITKFYCVDADIRGDYENGYVVEQMTTGEFENDIFAFVKPEDKAAEDDDIEALFS